jgi:hypothetical protein
VVAIFVLGMVLGLATLERKKSGPLRKARETHKPSMARPRTHPH